MEGTDDFGISSASGMNAHQSPSVTGNMIPGRGDRASPVSAEASSSRQANLATRPGPTKACEIPSVPVSQLSILAPHLGRGFPILVVAGNLCHGNTRYGSQVARRKQFSHAYIGSVFAVFPAFMIILEYTNDYRHNSHGDAPAYNSSGRLELKNPPNITCTVSKCAKCSRPQDGLPGEQQLHLEAARSQ